MGTASSARACAMKAALQEAQSSLAACRRENEALKRRLEEEAAKRDKCEAQLAAKGEAAIHELRATDALASLRVSHAAALVASAEEHGKLTATIQKLQMAQAALQRKHGELGCRRLAAHAVVVRHHTGGA